MSTAAKEATGRGRPSSRIVKSDCVSPRTGWPSSASTETSTWMSSIPPRKARLGRAGILRARARRRRCQQGDESEAGGAGHRATQDTATAGRSGRRVTRYGSRFNVHRTAAAGQVDDTPARLKVTVPLSVPNAKCERAGDGSSPLSGTLEDRVRRVPFGGIDIPPSVRPSSSADPVAVPVSPSENGEIEFAGGVRWNCNTNPAWTDLATYWLADTSIFRPTVTAVPACGFLTSPQAKLSPITSRR